MLNSHVIYEVLNPMHKFRPPTFDTVRVGYIFTNKMYFVA
jgi:hypothetical protein